MSYIGGYQCRASLWCPHNIYASSTYCNLLCFFRAPSLILILSIRQALFSRSRGRGRGGWRVWGTRFNFMTCSATVCMFVMYIMTKINFCYHATVLVIWFSIEWQFDNSSSWTCQNIAQCMIGIRLRFFILVLSISGPVFFLYNSAILQFLYNFSLAVANSVLFCFVFTLFSSD